MLGLGNVLVFSGRGAGSPALPSVESLSGMIYVRRADSPSNTTATIDIAFNPSDVDTTNHKLNITGIAAPEPVTMTASQQKDRFAPFYFANTGGQLPMTSRGQRLQPDTRYYLHEASGGGYYIYYEATDADATSLTYHYDGEIVYPGQFIAQKEGRVQFTDQGTGTHRIYTKPLCELLADTKNGLFGSRPVSATTTNVNDALELVTDGSRKYLRAPGAMMKTPYSPIYAQKGPGYTLQGNNLQFAQQFQGKRAVALIYVGKFPEIPPNKHYIRNILTSSNINTSTDVFTRTAHSFSTGMPVKVVLISGTLPGGLTDGETLYVGSVTTDTYSLYPSAADASANTLKIDITSGGTGEFMLINTRDPGDYTRPKLLTSVGYPSGSIQHLIAPAYDITSNYQSGIVRNQVRATVTGTGDGRITYVYDASLKNLWPVQPIMQMAFWTGIDGTLPIREDTGQPLVKNQSYYVTNDPTGSNSQRLFDTYADALASISKPSNLTNCIKFSAAEVGDMYAYRTDGKVRMSQVFNAPQPFPKSFQKSQRAIYVEMQDYNNPNYSNPVVSYGMNRLWNGGTELVNASRPKLIPSDATSNAYEILFGAPDSHVPAEFELEAMAFGAWDDMATMQSELETAVASFAADYGIDLAAFDPPAPVPVTPMNSIIPSCVLDLSANSEDSYPGAGNTVYNLITGGESDFWRGQNGTLTDTNNTAPAFVGDVGRPESYFAGNFNQWLNAKSVSTFMAQMHRSDSTQPWSIAFDFFFVPSDWYYFGSASTGAGFRMFRVNTNRARLFFRGAPAGPTKDIFDTGVGHEFTSYDWNTLIITWDPVTRTWGYKVNDNTYQTGTTTAFTITDDSTGPFNFAAAANSSGTPNGARFTNCMLFNTALSSADCTAVRNAIKARTGR